MTEQNPTRSEAEETIRRCECGKKMPACDTTEICLACVRKLNPKEFRETLDDLLSTWLAGRSDVEVEELHSLCPAISSMIRLQSKHKPNSPGGLGEAT